jgi:hypothetical protein
MSRLQLLACLPLLWSPWVQTWAANAEPDSVYLKRCHPGLTSSFLERHTIQISRESSDWTKTYTIQRKDNPKGAPLRLDSVHCSPGALGGNLDSIFFSRRNLPFQNAKNEHQDLNCHRTVCAYNLKDRVGFELGLGSHFRVSGDGKHLVFMLPEGGGVSHVDTLTRTQKVIYQDPKLNVPPDPEGLFEFEFYEKGWSPNQKYLYFFASRALPDEAPGPLRVIVDLKTAVTTGTVIDFDYEQIFLMDEALVIQSTHPKHSPSSSGAAPDPDIESKFMKKAHQRVSRLFATDLITGKKVLLAKSKGAFSPKWEPSRLSFVVNGKKNSLGVDELRRRIQSQKRSK